MRSQVQQKIIGLDGKISLKNVHLIKDIKIFNNKQIFIVSDSTIQIHSTDDMIEYLPSLVSTLELGKIVQNIERNNYCDELTRDLQNNEKAKFGEIVFGQQLTTQNNKLVKARYLVNRIRFLNSQFLKVKNFEIHQMGHLLITFQDKRSVLIKRQHPLALDPNYQQLYDIESPILLNNIIESPVIAPIFLPAQSPNQIVVMCGASPYSERPEIFSFSKIVIHEDNKHQVFSCSDNRKFKLVTNGFISLNFVSVNIQEGSGWLLILFYNRLEILEVGKTNQRNKNFPILAQKQVAFEQMGNQFVIKGWFYKHYKVNLQKHYKLFLLTSASIWELAFNSNKPDHNLNCFNYTLKQANRQSTKSLVYYINYKGKYFQHVLTKQQLPNFQANLALQTDNGLLIRVCSNPNNYKEGWLYLAYQKNEVVQKSIQNILAKNKGDKHWLNFEDVSWISKNTQIKKQIIKQLNEAKASKQSQLTLLPNSMNQILFLNLFKSLEYNQEKQNQIIQKSMRFQLNLEASTQIEINKCSVTGRKITSEDVVYCSRCQLYSIKDAVGWKCCYICWNSNFHLY